VKRTVFMTELSLLVNCCVSHMVGVRE